MSDTVPVDYRQRLAGTTPAGYTLTVEFLPRKSRSPGGDIGIGGALYPAKLTDHRIFLWCPEVAWRGNLRRWDPGRVEFDRETLRCRTSCLQVKMSQRLSPAGMGPATSPVILEVIVANAKLIDAAEGRLLAYRDAKDAMQAAESELKRLARGESVDATVLLHAAVTYRAAWALYERLSTGVASNWALYERLQTGVAPENR